MATWFASVSLALRIERTRNNMEPKRKLKIDKRFQPPSFDAGDEFYPNGIFEFNITKLLAFIKANSDRFPEEEVEIETIRSFSSDNLDESTIQNANISIPIVLAEISPGRFNVIDGNHRLENAFRRGVKKIPAFKITSEHHVVFLVSKECHKAYIEYWNSKIDIGKFEMPSKKSNILSQ